MADNKKQHFVPVFYLKRFSANEVSINIFNISLKKIITNGNLKNQCYKDYLYGKNLKNEKALGKIETAASRILKEIGTTCKLPIMYSNDHNELLLYVILQHGRTNYAIEELNENYDKFYKYFMLNSGKFKQEELDLVKISNNKSPGLSIFYAVTGYVLGIDLSYKLITIKGNYDFICSDNPVVFYNQFFEWRKETSNTGIGSKGLQIFFPIDNKNLLLFYDSTVYDVGDNDTYTIFIDDKDIKEINKLQVVNAEFNLYFTNEKENIIELFNQSNEFRRNEKTILKVFSKNETNNRRRDFVTLSRSDIKIKLKLSFIQIHKHAIEWMNNFRKLKSQPVIIPRNQYMDDCHNEFLKLVEKKKYKATEFFKFMANKESN